MASHDVDALATMAWEAALPVQCTLAEGCRDDRQQGADNECYFMVPRQGFLGYSLKVVMSTFSHIPVLADGRQCFVWFTYKPPGCRDGDELVLPWHYPMGVVVDRLTATSGAESVNSLFQYALHLTVIFSETPPTGEDVIPMTVKGVEKGVDTWLKQCHKASLMSRFGTIRPWVSFDTSAYSDFLAAPRTNDVGAFFVGRAGLEAQCKRDLDKDAYDRGDRLAYIVLHIDGHPTPLVADIEALPTLGMLLRDTLPCCYSLSDEDVQSLDPLPCAIARVFVLGTHPPLATPLAFLRDHLCCADLAVHLVVSPTVSNAPRPRPTPSGTDSTPLGASQARFDESSTREEPTRAEGDVNERPDPTQDRNL
uniref:Autophagy protein 5 n=1 Tax=Neobodo designis TaxID=312471 RepID=A0A7S1QP15_NEODS